MRKTKRMHRVQKAIGLFCSLVLLVCALYVPFALSASAISSVTITDNTPVVFDFEDTVTDAIKGPDGNSLNSNEAKGNAGIGYYGWGPSVKVYTEADGSKNTVLRAEKPDTNLWATSGGYRLHTKMADGTYGFYQLETSSKYVVSFKIRVMASPKSLEGSNPTNKAMVYLGFNSSYNSNQSGEVSNYINNMAKKISVMETVMDSNTFSLYDTNGKTTAYNCSEEWHNVRYFIDTPASFSADPALAFWATKYHGVECEIDDVSVIKVGANSGMVTFVDQYSGTEEIAFGDIGTAVTLPDIADRSQHADHTFGGWYINEERTQKAENVTFTAQAQTIYSRWNAPVTVTFKNTLDGTETKVTGSSGDALQFPADPVDPSGESWFMGWYTDEGCTNEYTSNKYGYANMTLYSFFKGKIPGINEGFENYTKDAYTVIYDNGQARKSNYLDFGATMHKQSEVTYNDSNYAIKFHWNPVQITDKNNEHYYDASRYTAKDNYFNIGAGLENNQLYVVSFKYKAEKVNAPVKFYMISAADGNTWVGGTRTVYPDQTATLKQSDEWQEMSFQITTDLKTGGNYMYFGVSLTQNEETIIYFDDISVEAFAQPYESVIKLHTNIDDEVISIKGVRGEKIKFPTITHPLGAEFKGWFTDVNLSVPYAATTFERGKVEIYAKWLSYSGFVQDFENYTQDYGTDKIVEKTYNNGTPNDATDDIKIDATYKSNYMYFWTTLSKQSEVTHSGNYAIKFNWDTDPSTNKIIKPGEPSLNDSDTYEHSRYSAADNYFVVGNNLENNQIYTVTFKYKVEKGDQNVQFYLATAGSTNVWAGRQTYYLPESVDLKPSNEWHEATYELVTGEMGNNNSLFLGVKLSEHKDTIIYFDDVKVKAVPNQEQCVIYMNNGYESQAVRHFGIKGEEIKLPALNHPDGAPFQGWYTDATFTTPFEATVYPNYNVILYAKWGACPMTFKTYAFEGHPYADAFINRVTAKGIGNGDDHAMRWTRKHASAYKGTASNAFVIHKGVEDGATYRIKYDYKVNAANSAGTLVMISAEYQNIWVGSVKTTYQATSVAIPEGGTNGWKTAEAYITAKEIDAGNNWDKSDAFFLQFSFPNGVSAAGTNIDVLIDNVLVEKIEAPFVSFDGQNNKSCTVIKGNAGDEIKLPANPEKIGHNFKGWYLEPECTTPFDLKTFAADTAETAYAKWEKSTSSTYSFEGYTLVEGAGFALLDGELSSRLAKTGKNSVRFGDRTPGNYESRSYFAIEDSGEYYKLEYKRQYVITMNYYIKECAPSSLNISFIGAVPGNIWTGMSSGKISGAQTINYSMAKAQKGKWTSMTFAIDTSELKDNDYGQALDGLFVLMTGGENWEIYFDDVTITEVPKGKSVVVIDTEGAKGAPTHLIGSAGASYANKIPETLTKEGMFFKGYFTKSADGAFLPLERENMKFGEKATVIYGRFLEYEINENFDEGFYDKAYGKGLGYSIHDFDYEVYDSEKEGNSKDNVTSGRYSLHRKGNTMYNENSVILTLGNQIAEGERYTVTFKVKMGKHFHTDGAVKIASGRSFDYAWTTTGDYHPVVAIADLTDGQWHEVSYTFNSVEAFAVLQTPGYVELFVDDFKFTLVDENTPVSTPVTYTEYVPAERDADGNLLVKDRTAVDISSIIDDSLSGASFPWLWVIIGAVVLVLAGGAVAVILMKKKKSKV